LEVAAKVSPEARAALAGGVEPPETLLYLYGWWQELRAAAGSGMDGPAPLSYRDLDAWARLTDRHPEPLEVRAILQIDAVARRGWREGMSTEGGKG
jgi:hypothetical protein